MRLEQAHHGGQHQGQRNEGHIAGDEVEQGRGVHLGVFRLAAALGRHGALFARLGLGRALGLEGLDVAVLGVIAVVVVLVDLAAVAHPGVGRLGLGVVVFFLFPALGDHLFAGVLQHLGGHGAGVHAFHADHAHIGAQALVQLAMAHVHADHLGRAALQQAVGEAAGALAHVQAAQAVDLQAGGLERAFELQAAARDVLGLGVVEQLQLDARGNVVTILGNLLPRGQRRQAPFHARSDQALRLGAGGGIAVVHQKYICAHSVFPLILKQAPSAHPVCACSYQKWNAPGAEPRPLPRLRSAMISSGRCQACKGLACSHRCRRLAHRSARSAWRRPSSGAGARPFRPGPWAARRPCRLGTRPAW